ncbi:MAG TPA: hypothetical protein VGT60_06945 [Candidatus Limnocylindria bacterium]|nr:hypothetical protein [Candidatus Limnocylindria bacterium]
MDSLVAPKALSLIDPASGEIVPIDLAPISAEDAAAKLPVVQRAIRELRRFEAFLLEVIGASFVEGQTEKRIADQLFERKLETAWVIDDEGALWALLHAAAVREEITEAEFAKATTQVVSYRFNHSVLNVLVKRIPAIDTLRHRVTGDAKLRIKA